MNDIPVFKADGRLTEAALTWLALNSLWAQQVEAESDWTRRPLRYDIRRDNDPTCGITHVVYVSNRMHLAYLEQGCRTSRLIK